MKILDVPRSGSYQGITSSRNRFGQYVRTRATPVNPNSTPQAVVRSRMAANAAVWRTLTDVQRAGWESLGAEISRNDGLGQTYTLNGFMAFCSVNNNRLAVGVARTLTAPTITVPANVDSVTVTLTAAAFSVAYTATPLATSVRLLGYASPQRSAGRTFENDFRLIGFSTAAAASPLVLTTAYAARLGTPVVGNRVFMNFATYNNGFVSLPLEVSQIVA
jgi:hypothetical protein